jgi:uncharacterized protein YkwD
LLRQVTWLVLFLVLIGLSACSLAQKVLPARTANAVGVDYTTYTVQADDTLSQIAARFHITVEQIIALNSDRYPSLARDPSSLRTGWQLRVPKSVTSAQATGTADAELPRVDLAEATRIIIEGINSQRGQQQLLPLRTDVALTRIAADRSSDMVTREYFSHYDPQTGQEPLLRGLQASKFSYQYAGENLAEIKNEAGWVPPLMTVAARYSAADLANEFLKGWINSPEHRDNILNSHYQRTGVALAVRQDGHRIVATQVFSD